MAGNGDLAMIKAGWVEKEGSPGIYIPGPNLVRPEDGTWSPEPDDIVRAIEDAFKQAK